MNIPPAVSYERLAGCALASMCGDALGMPVEGWTAEDIQRRHGRLGDMVAGRLPAGSFTDDSQMMVAILRALAQSCRLDPGHLAREFSAAFEPQRGYGGRIAGVMQRLGLGAAWDQAGTDSFGNGGAMRVGVLGVYHADQPKALRAAALDQCRITHTHPRGLAGALAQAMAVGLGARLGARGMRPDARAVVREIAEQVEGVDRHTAERLRAMPALPRGDEPAARRALASAYACDVTAPESMPAALGCFLAARDLEQAVVLAVSLGGDTDTLGAMAGALAGAYWGLAAVPARWLGALENQKGGRDEVLALCRLVLEQKPVDGLPPD